MALIQTQPNPNVIIQDTVHTHNNVPKTYETSDITPAVNAAYNNGATTVSVIDKDGIGIGVTPRPRPH